MGCEWCGIAGASSNHASTTECVEALELEVTRLREVAMERAGFMNRQRIEDQRGDLVWKFKTK